MIALIILATYHKDDADQNYDDADNYNYAKSNYNCLSKGPSAHFMIALILATHSI